jgi:hypothetical protein
MGLHGLEQGYLYHYLTIKNAVSEERRFTQYLHGVTSQKMVFFVVIGVKTSNPTQP